MQIVIQKGLCSYETLLNDIPVLNVLLITCSLGLHEICILKKTSSMGA